MILKASPPLPSLTAIQRKMPMMVGKMRGVIKVANKKDFFLTRARYSLLITKKILYMIVFFDFLNKDFLYGRNYLLKAQDFPVLHQVAQHLIGLDIIQG